MIMVEQASKSLGTRGGVSLLNSHIPTEHEWWGVIRAMADFVASGVEYGDLEDELIQSELVSLGFKQTAIEQALDWLETASMSGHVTEVLSMLQPSGTHTRVASPLETASMSDKMWNSFEALRRRGLISPDVAERLLEAIRGMDARDWDDEEASSFLYDFVASALPHHPEHLLRKIIEQSKVPEFYS